MAVIAKPFPLGLQHVFNADIDWTADSIKALLSEDSYGDGRSNASAPESYYDIASNEAPASSGYTLGGIAVTSRSVGIDIATGTPFLRLLADSLHWSNLAATFHSIVFYKVTGDPHTSYLLSYIDLGRFVVVSSAQNYDVDLTLGVCAIELS